jgi:hypothetical protein
LSLRKVVHHMLGLVGPCLNFPRSVRLYAECRLTGD